eukprot:11191627-Lingulodinium_polyedra.AAC.1
MPLCFHPNEFASVHSPFGVASTLHSARGQPRPESAQLNRGTHFAMPPSTLNSRMGSAEGGVRAPARSVWRPPWGL